MSLTSFEFLLFVAIACIGYYLIPRKWQWVWLLGFSYIYYASNGIWLVGYILFTTMTTYGAAILIEQERENQKKSRKIVVITLLLNFGILALLKYTGFAVANVNRIFGTGISFETIILPLGISFYTFQSMGYLLDVHWGKVKAEENILRFALFVSFFPQILQGPIARFERLGKQLYEQHSFDFKRCEYAFQLILWGFFKKMVLADNIAKYVDEVFHNYQSYTGVTVVVAVLGYSIQLYGDFSGGMDVVKGIAYLFGIELDDNFKRPYFARSITDFWHRWHITLGTWMKDYVFYPVSLSKPMGKFKKYAKKKFGKNIGRTLPICIANLIVFLVVGVWHGAAWHFIIYGFYNGMIIAISGLLAQNYRKWKKKLHIQDQSKGWIIFQILRTFLLVNISWLLDLGGDVKQAVVMFGNIFRNFHISDFWNGKLLLEGIDSIDIKLMIVVIGCVVLFVISFIEEQGIEVGEVLISSPALVRIAVYIMMIFVLPLLGESPSLVGGFIYAQF